MALKESEAIVLRTYPLRESDLLVTLFTRLEGKVKGVARAAMKSRRRFGGALDREASDAVFRLSLAVLQQLRGATLWMPLTYFELWMTRLMGFLPEFSECAVCGRSFDQSRDGSGEGRAFYHALADGLVCIDDKRIASSELSAESRKIAAQMLRSRVSDFAEIDWPKAVCADLRKFLLQILERHIEKKLVTAAMLQKVG